MHTIYCIRVRSQHPQHRYYTNKHQVPGTNTSSYPEANYSQCFVINKSVIPRETNQPQLPRFQIPFADASQERRTQPSTWATTRVWGQSSFCQCSPFNVQNATRDLWKILTPLWILTGQSLWCSASLSFTYPGCKCWLSWAIWLLCDSSSASPHPAALTWSVAPLWVYPVSQEQSASHFTDSKHRWQNYRSVISDPGQSMIHKETKQASDGPRETTKGRIRERMDKMHSLYLCIFIFLQFF